jgi:peptidoglycan hydrolase-like protein with peptidoglycan-binding domain
MNQTERPMNNGQQQAGQLEPSQLSKDQITELQQALKDKGNDAVKVDGIWGPETQAALKKFQNEHNIQASGQIDQQTQSALGVQLASQDQRGQPGTGGEPSTTGSGASQPSTTGSSPASTSGAGSQNGQSDNGGRTDQR